MDDLELMSIADSHCGSMRRIAKALEDILIEVRKQSSNTIAAEL